MKDVFELYESIQPLIEKGKTEKAIESLEKLLFDHPDFAKGHYDLGTMYLENGNKEKAESSYLRAAVCEPENYSLLKSLGDFYYVKMENREKALEYYRKIIDNDVEDADVFFIAGNLSLVEHQYEKAIHYYEKVLEIEPWHMEAFDFLEKVRAHVNLKEEGTNGESVEALYEKASRMGAEGKNEIAVSLLEKVIEMEPEHAIAHNDMAVYSYRLGNEEKGLDHYRIATQLEPSNATFQKNMADFLCFVKGDIAEALTIYLKLLKQDPEDVEILMAVGHINRAVGRVTDSRLYYERVLDIEPWNYNAGEMLNGLKQSGAESKTVLV